ncbi:hypothetical protein L6R52_35230 [Myxococcota bacterium]|nr:hypothetical protein [Myxococcota bacterium]
MGTRDHGRAAAQHPDHDEDTAPERGTEPDRLTHRALAVCDAVGVFIEVWGFRSIHGRVWTYLALQTRPVAQAEIAEVLGVSRSLVSLAMSELHGYGLVRPVGSQRHAPYEASMDVWPTITDVLRGREWMMIERARVALEALLSDAEYARDSGHASVYDVSRIRVLLTMTELAQAGLRAVLSIRVPSSIDAFGEWLERASRFFVHLPRFPGLGV